MNSKTVTVRMPTTIRDALIQRADAEERTMSAMLVLLLKAALEKEPTLAGTVSRPSVSGDCVVRDARVPVGGSPASAS